MVATATVQFYDVVVFFHVAAVVIGFGPTFAYGAYMATAQREGGGAIPTIGRTMVLWDRTVFTVAMTLVLLTGIYLAADGPYGMGGFFISWGFVAIIVLFGLAHAFFIPRTKRAVELAERDLAVPRRQALGRVRGAERPAREGRGLRRHRRHPDDLRNDRKALPVRTAWTGAYRRPRRLTA